MRATLILTVVACVIASNAAVADDLVSVRPGVMCASKGALAWLTLHDGDSRTHRRPVEAADVGIASAGGCIDIPPGARVSVIKGYRNTSIATYAGETFVVPNIDFAPAGHTDAAAEASPTRPVTTLAVGDGETLMLFEDSRITPALQRLMWGSSEDPSMRMDAAMLAELARRPLLAARLELRAASGRVRDSKTLPSPAATLMPAGLRGLPDAAFLLTTDLGVGMGSYAGPTTEIVEPARQGLRPVDAVDAHGRTEAIVLPDTPKRAWRIVPSRDGATDEIEFASSDLQDDGEWTTTYETFRFDDRRWRMTGRTALGMWENKKFPPRSDFP